MADDNDNSMWSDKTAKATVVKKANEFLRDVAGGGSPWRARSSTAKTAVISDRACPRCQRRWG